MDSEKLAALYEEAGTFDRLGEMLGTSGITAKRWLIAAGIPVKKRRFRAYSPVDAIPTDPDAIKAAYAAAGSVNRLSRDWGVSYPTAYQKLTGAGIEVNRKGFRSPGAGSHKRGADHHNWKGGTYQKSDGYIYEYAPDHPAAKAAKGYVLQHRLVMEAHLGRLLAGHELVHHKNEDKQDNRLENLEVTTRIPHIRHHKSSAPRDDRGRFAT